MKATIYQPQYFPRLHYFNRILSADTFVILNSAQYTKSLVHLTDTGRERHKSYQSDMPIKISQGLHLLTIPIKQGNGNLQLNQTGMDYSQNWAAKHLIAIKSAYGRSPRFAEIFPQIEELLKKQYDSLSDLNTATIVWGISKLAGIDLKGENMLDMLNEKLAASAPHFTLKKVVLDSQLGVLRPEGLQKGTEWTTAILTSIGATEYYYGGTAKESYMDLSHYEKNGITPIQQNWKCDEYNQQFIQNAGFLANLSIIDLLMNTDVEEAAKIIKGT